MMQKLTYIVFFGIAWLITLLPLRIIYLFSDLLYFIMYYLVRYRKKVVYLNLRNSFPDKSRAEIITISRKFYQHLCDYFVESIAFMNFSVQEINNRYRYKNPGLLDEYFQMGRSVIGVLGHYGNWEWSANLPLHTKLKILAIYKPLKNKHFDRLFKMLREKHGVETIPLNQTLKKLLSYKSQNVPTYTMFLADQRPIAKNIRYWTTFLNQETPVLLGVEKISKKTNSAIVFSKVEKIKRGYYEVEFIKLFDNVADVNGHEITEKHLSVLESLIMQKPEYWLWSHKRWKHDRKKVEEKYGKLSDKKI